MQHKTLAYRRMQREKHIARKVRINRECFGSETKVRGIFDKGKVHCSCPACSFHGYTMQERKRAGAMLGMLDELGERVSVPGPSNKLKSIIRNSGGNGYRTRPAYNNEGNKTVRIEEWLMERDGLKYRKAVADIMRYVYENEDLFSGNDYRRIFAACHRLYKGIGEEFDISGGAAPGRYEEASLKVTDAVTDLKTAVRMAETRTAPAANM